MSGDYAIIIKQGVEVKKLILAIIAIVAISVIGIANQGSASATSCSLAIVDGPGNHGIKVSADKKSAYSTVVINGDKNCKKSFTLAAWKLPNKKGLPLTAQKFFGYKTMTKGPGRHVITTAIPECYWQVDLLGGTRPKSIHGDANYQWPQDQLANFKLGGNKSCTSTPPPPPPPVQDPTCTLVSDVTSLPVGGGKVKLTWTSKNADQATILGLGAVDVNGSQDVTVDKSTIFTGTFTNTKTNPVKSVTCTVTVTVPNTPPPTPNDVCPNIEGMQETIPDGYTRDASGNCIIVPAGSSPEQVVSKLSDTGPGLFAGIASSMTAIGSGAAHFVLRRKKI